MRLSEEVDVNEVCWSVAADDGVSGVSAVAGVVSAWRMPGGQGTPTHRPPASLIDNPPPIPSCCRTSRRCGPPPHALGNSGTCSCVPPGKATCSPTPDKRLPSMYSLFLGSWFSGWRRHLLAPSTRHMAPSRAGLALSCAPRPPWGLCSTALVPRPQG